MPKKSFVSTSMVGKREDAAHLCYAAPIHISTKPLSRINTFFSHAGVFERTVATSGANVTSDSGCISTDTAPSSHQRRTRCPTTAPMNAMMAQAAVYQVAKNAVLSFLQATVKAMAPTDAECTPMTAPANRGCVGAPFRITTNVRIMPGSERKRMLPMQKATAVLLLPVIGRATGSNMTPQARKMTAGARAYSAVADAPGVAA